MSLRENYKRGTSAAKAVLILHIYVAVETATYKDSRVLTQTLMPVPRGI